jgi:hypothetical protein
VPRHFPPRDGIDSRLAAVGLCIATVVGLVAIAILNPPLATRLVSEDSVVEWLQVLLAAATGVLAFRQGRAARRAGEPATLEVAIVAAMVIICIGEVDLDRVFFGTKVISTKFFVNPNRSIVARALAVLVVVGAPLALGIWLLVHFRHLWRAGMAGLRQPWGQPAAFGMALFLAVEVFERPLGRIRSLPPYFAEETLELLATLCMFVGIAARRGKSSDWKFSHRSHD